MPRAANSGRVVGCHLTAQQKARVLDAFKGHAELSFLESFDELFCRLHEHVESIDVVIVPAHDRDGRGIAGVVRQIAAERPRVAIIAYCQAGLQYSADIRELTAAGAHQIALTGITDQGIAFRNVLATARRACAADTVMQELDRIVPPLLHGIVEAILSRPQDVTSIKELADHLGVHRKTLFNWCARAGFLPPAEVLVWCRLVLVGHHLSNTACTVEAIAIEIGFPSDTALRNTLKRYTGMTATAVKQSGGGAAVVNALRRRLAQKAPLHLV